MSKVIVYPCAKLKLSNQDKDDLRVLILKIMDFSKEVNSTEETIRYSIRMSEEFIESRFLEIIEQKEHT